MASKDCLWRRGRGPVWRRNNAGGARRHATAACGSVGTVPTRTYMVTYVRNASVNDRGRRLPNRVKADQKSPPL